MASKKLTIGFVLDDGLDKPDGVQQYVLGLGGWFASRGHNVHYLVGQTARDDIPNLHVMSKNASVKFNGNKLTIPLVSSKRNIRSTLDKHDFDVLHVQMPYSPFMGGRVIANASAKIAVVGTFHIFPYGLMSRVGSVLLGLTLRVQTSRFDKVFAVSKPAQQLAARNYYLQPTVLANFVDQTKYLRGRKSSGKKIKMIFVNRLVPRKGCGYLLKALDYAIQKKMIEPSNLTVDICGSGTQRQKLEDFCRRRGLTSVKFHGFVSESKKRQLLSEADVAVYPSIGGESFGIVLLEAMASGCGVLAGDNPGYRSVLEDGSPQALFDPRDSQAFGDKLTAVVNDKSFRQELIKTQQNFIGKFYLDNIAGDLLQEYSKASRNRLKLNKGK